MRKIFSRSAVGAAVVLGLANVGAARAGEPAEDALAAWVASIDATDLWTAHYRGIAYDAATRTATLSGLSLQMDNGAASVDFETIALTGFAASADGGFTAEAIKADGGTAEAGFVKIAVSDIELERVAVPRLDSIAIDKDKPFTSMVRAYAQIAKTTLGHASIAEVAVIEQVQDVTSRITYQNLKTEGIAGGKIAALTAGPLKLESPSPDGLVAMTIAGVETRDVDIGALVRVYDPDQYADGIGDEVWHTVLGRSAYHDITIEVPGAKIAIGETSLENLRARQPKRSFAEFFDTVMANPGAQPDNLNIDAIRNAVGMISAFGVGRFGIDGLNVEATGIDRMKLGSFHIADLSSDGLGELAFDGVDGAVGGQGSVQIGHFAFGGITFPSADALIAAIDADEKGEPVDYLGLSPTLGFVEASAIAFAAKDTPTAKLDRARLELGDYVGAVPTSVSSEIVGVDIPAALIKDPQAKATLDKLGYDRVNTDYRVKLRWHEADQSLSIDDFYVGMKDLGSLTATAGLTGLTRDAIEHVATLGDALAGLSLASAKLTFRDDSIVGRGLGLLATKMKVPPDKFRQQFADALPLLLTLAAVNDPQLMAIVKESGLLPKLTPVIKQFVATPGAFVITAAPAAPVPIAALAAAANEAPETVPSLLNLDFANEPLPQ